MKTLFCVFSLFCLTSASIISPINVSDDGDDTVVVTIKNGQIRGNTFQTYEQGLPFYAFRGIPYAQPPIGDLRFEAPLPAEDWADIKNTTEDPVQCIQNDPFPNGSEDCLFLSVYAPANNNGSLPVMLWVHGGGFLFGAAKYGSYAPDYLLEQDVIFVAVQYRLNIFGYLSTGDMVLPGNAAVKDVILALQWVQDNIETFGGDKSRVTIFGESAGSAMVSYVVQAKKAEGLFHGAILESGTTLSIWSYSRYPKNFAVRIAEKLNIDTLDSQRLVEELKGADPYLLEWISITLTGVYMLNDLNNGFYFAPSIEPEHDGAVFTEKSHQLMENGDFNRVPLIIGFNSQEGIMFSLYIVSLIASLYELNIAKIPPADLGITDQTIAAELGAKIHEFYWGNSSILDAPEINTTQYISDHEFVRSIHETVRLQSKHTPVYYYKFSYEGFNTSRPLPGVSHGDELMYIFRKDHGGNETDHLVRSRMVKMWTNFAKFGNPTPVEDPVLDNVIWPVANESEDENLTYMEILDKLVVGKNPNQEHVEFWDNIYKTYGQPPFDTY